MGMEKRLIFLIFVQVFFFTNVYSQKNIYNENKDKLEKIKMEIDAKNKEYDEYMKRYNELLQEMNELKKSAKNYLKRKQEIEDSIRELKAKISENRKKYSILSDTQKSLVDDITEDMSFFYLSRFSSNIFYSTQDIVRDLIMRNIIINKSKYFFAIENEKKVSTKKYFELDNKQKEMSKEREYTLKQIMQQNDMQKKKEKELYQTDKKLSELKKEIEELNRTAVELTSLIKSVEKKSPYRKVDLSKMLPDIPKKSLPWPCEGRVVSYFGKEYIKELKTWVVNNGIKVQTDGSSVVKPVMNGKVVFVGRFRSYGNIVLIEHEGGIYTTYGLLSEVYVKNGETVSLLTELGKSGMDPRNLDNKDRYVVYFEIRKGDIPLNPLDYLK